MRVVLWWKEMGSGHGRQAVGRLQCNRQVAHQIIIKLQTNAAANLIHVAQL